MDNKAITIKEIRQLIADKSDPSQPLNVLARDLGKKAAKHSGMRVNETLPTKVNVTLGQYDERSSIEFAHNPGGDALMPGDVLAALDGLLETEPKATLGWVYFFYYPLKYKGFLGKIKQIKDCLLDTNNVIDVYFSEDEPNTLVFMAPFTLGSFDF